MKKFTKMTLLAICYCSVFTIAIAKTPATPEQQRARFVQQMHDRYHFNKAKLNTLLKNSPYLPAVIESMQRPFESRPWSFYQKFFVSPKRIQLGVKYWHQHAKTLAAAQKKYGVDPSVIVAIIGMETLYGTHTGKYPTLATLNTLAFHYPRQGRFFKKELREFLLLTRDNHLSATALKGSYAGALGIPQFMPSSYRHYAIDFSRNDQVNLISNHDDAIASIGNYLAKNGWKRGQPIAAQLNKHARIPKAFISKTGKPTTTLKQLHNNHIMLKKHFRNNYRVAIIKLTSKNHSEHWVGFNNFKSIMSYNHSPLYAMAVYQLSQKIKALHG